MDRLDLYLDQRSIIRNPLERTLIQALMKDQSMNVTYDPKVHVWELNGKKIIYNRKQTYSPLITTIKLLFHIALMHFSAVYRRKFHNAKVKLLNAQTLTRQQWNRDKRQIIYRKDRLFEKAEKIEQAISKTEFLIKTLDLKKNEMYQVHLKNLGQLKELSLEHIKTKDLLQQFQIAKEQNNVTLRNELKEELLERSLFNLFDFSKAAKGELDRIIEYQMECLAKLNKKILKETTSWEQLQTKFNQDQSDFTQQKVLLLKQLDEIKHSPLLKKFGLSKGTSTNLPLNPDSTQEVQVEEKVLNDATILLLDKIKANLGDEAGHIWQNLFEHFLIKHKENMILECAKQGSSYVITFQEPLRIWLLSTNEEGQEDPEGGVVLMLGMNKNKLRLNFNKPNTMQFERNSAQLYTKLPPWAILLFKSLKWVTFGLFHLPEYVSATVTEFTQISRFLFSLTAGYRDKVKTREKTYDDLIFNWSAKGPGRVLKRDEIPEEIIKERLALKVRSNATIDFNALSEVAIET